MTAALKSPPPNAKDRAPGASSSKSAAATGRSGGVTLNDVFDEVAESAPVVSRKRRRVSKQEVADMTAQLAIMVKSGVDLASGLTSLAAQCERPAMAEILEEVNELVVSGNTLSESLKQFPDVFDAAYTATIAAAEASGRMADVLRQLATMQRNEVKLRRSIRGLLTYPILLTIICSAVIATLVIVVLPKFAQIFDDYGAKLPATTEALIAISTELKSRWWLWLPLGGGGLCAFFAWKNTDAGQRVVDGVFVNGAQLRNVVRPLLIGRLCRMLSLLLTSGVTLLEGLRLCRAAINNSYYKELLDELIDSVVNGKGMGATLLEAEIIPPSAREMISTAERTGNLAEVTQLLGEYYEEEAENKMKQVVRLLEPLITVVMGAIVAFVVLSVMLPIFDLSSVAQGGGK
jgi:type II secretory pathway component PulF